MNLKKEKIYITKKGLEKVKKDFQNLKLLKLSKTTGEAPAFFHSDDLDSEYLILQDDLDLLEAKLFDLEHIIKNAEIINPPLRKLQDVVQVGAKILLDIDGQEDEFMILGALEANPFLGIISNESPVGRALLGHKKGEQIIISSPIKTHYTIKRIKYS